MNQQLMERITKKLSTCSDRKPEDWNVSYRLLCEMIEQEIPLVSYSPEAEEQDWFSYAQKNLLLCLTAAKEDAEFEHTYLDRCLALSNAVIDAFLTDGLVEQAIEYALQTFTVCNLYPEQETELIKAHEQLGHVYASDQQHHKAIKIYCKEIQLLENSSPLNYQDIAHAYYYIADEYECLQDTDNVIENYEKAASYCTEGYGTGDHNQNLLLFKLVIYKNLSSYYESIGWDSRKQKIDGKAKVLCHQITKIYYGSSLQE